MSYPDHARVKGRRLVRDLLGIEPAAKSLFDRAEEVLGRARTQRCVEWIRASPITRRVDELAAIASLVVATRTLGIGWWQQLRTSERADSSSPDSLLVKDLVGSGTPLGVLESWAEDDVATALWGRAIAEVDLNSLIVSDRVALPPDARPGQHLVLSFDPGGRVDAVVTTRADGSLGSELKLDTCRHSPPSEASWGWGVSAGLGPHYLPGEIAGSPADPYASPVDRVAARTIRARALDLGASTSGVGASWKDVSSVIAAIEATNMVEQRTGRWHAWDRAARALADRDSDRIRDALDQL